MAENSGSCCYDPGLALQAERAITEANAHTLNNLIFKYRACTGYYTDLPSICKPPCLGGNRCSLILQAVAYGRCATVEEAITYVDKWLTLPPMEDDGAVVRSSGLQPLASGSCDAGPHLI